MALILNNFCLTDTVSVEEDITDSSATVYCGLDVHFLQAETYHRMHEDFYMKPYIFKRCFL
jgi:hypothetical protein